MSEVEKSILGSALITPENAYIVTSRLTADDFELPQHGTIFEAVAGAVADGEPVDAMTIAARLGDAIGRVGGHPYIFELMQLAQPGSIDYQIKTVKNAATKRRLALAGMRIQTLAEHEDADSAIAQAQDVLDSVAGVEVPEAHLIGDTIDSTFETIRRAQDGSTPKGTMSGFADLDHLTNGFQPGQMVIVAARPGVGKSTIGVDMMRHLSIRNDTPTLIFSLEMSEDEINQRVLSAESGVLLADIRAGRLDGEAWSRLDAARAQIERAPMFIDATPETTIMDIVAKTKMFVARHGVKLVVIDYLQLLSSGSVRAESRQQEVASWSRQIKLLAKSAGIPVIAVAQLNRGPESRDGGMPKASDLRESGALEQDADIILLLHREEINNPDSAKAGEVDVKVAKNRGGRTGTVTLANQLHYGKFGDIR